VIEGFADGLILPAAFLALLGWLVPRLLSLVWPEGVWPLLLLALASAVLMMGLGMAFFAGLYVWQGVPFAMLTEAGWGPFLLHFLRLGSISALLWAPIMVLSVAGLPRHWTRATW
jgi:hypothetical protein